MVEVYCVDILGEVMIFNVDPVSDAEVEKAAPSKSTRHFPAVGLRPGHMGWVLRLEMSDDAQRI